MCIQFIKKLFNTQTNEIWSIIVPEDSLQMINF